MKNETAYAVDVWDQYARAFLAIMPSMMFELNKAVAALAKGNVFDFGCGAAKIAPFILERNEVSSYTGIDYSPRMVELARWHLKQFPSKPSNIMCGRIEEIDREPAEVDVMPGVTITVSPKRYDFGLSINSYYTWDTPEIVLRTIYHILEAEGEFVLVTPNPRLNIEKILEDVKKEQVANPYFETFKEQNRAIVGNEKALFVDMNDLILQVQKVGFKVIEAKQNFYHNGLNFLYLKK
jgi:SAM-dependent methyltransferase